MNEKIYYINVNGKQEGPFALGELEPFGITATSRIFKKGNPGFLDAKEIIEIREYYLSGNRPVAQPVKAAEPVKPAEDDLLDRDMAREAAERYRREKEERQRQEQERRRQEQERQIMPPPVENGAGTIPPDFGSVTEPKEWYLSEGGVQRGPMSLSELKASGLTVTTDVWRADMPGWVKATEVAEISPFVAPPVIPAVPGGGVTPPPFNAPGMGDTADIMDTGAASTSGNPLGNIDYGHPHYAAIPGFILSLAFTAIMIYMIMNDQVLSELSELRYFYADDARIIGVACALPALILGIAALCTSSMARQAYFKDRIDRALKLSGAASGYGIAAIIYSGFMCIAASVLMRALGIL